MVKKKETVTLTRTDWLNQGLIVLAKKGVEAVRVEPLAKQLGVTKGSFYWHFKNRNDLLRALLQAWVEAQTDHVIDRVESMGGDASTKLKHLFAIAVEDDGQVENAIRAWARHDSETAAVLKEVDQRRLDYTYRLFLDVGFDPFDARVRARMVYYALVGEFTIGTRSDRAERLEEIQHQHSILTTLSIGRMNRN